LPCSGRDGTIDSGYDVEGRLVSVVSPQGSVYYSYDDASGLKTRMYTDSTTSPTTDVSYGYDREGRLTTVTVNRLNGVSVGLVTTYTFDLNNNLLTTGSGPRGPGPRGQTECAP